MQCVRVSDISVGSVRKSSIHSASQDVKFSKSVPFDLDPDDPSFYLEDTDSGVMYDDFAGLLPRRGFIARIGRMLKKEVTGHGPPESGISGVIFLRRQPAPVPQLPPPSIQNDSDRDRVVRLPRARGFRPVRPNTVTPDNVLEPDEQIRPSMPPPSRVRRWRRMRPSPAPLPPPLPSMSVSQCGDSSTVTDVSHRHSLNYHSKVNPGRQMQMRQASVSPPSDDGYSTDSSSPSSLDVAFVDVASAIVDIDSENDNDDENDLHSARSMSVTMSTDDSADVVWRTALSDGSTIKSDAATSGVSSPTNTQDTCSPKRVWESGTRPAWEPVKDSASNIGKLHTISQTSRVHSVLQDSEFVQRYSKPWEVREDRERMTCTRPVTGVVKEDGHLSTLRKARWEQMAAARKIQVTQLNGVKTRAETGVMEENRRFGFNGANQRALPRTVNAQRDRDRERDRIRAKTDVQEIVGMRKDDFVEFQCKGNKGRGRQMRILSNVARFTFGGEGIEDEDQKEELKWREKERRSTSVGKAAVSSVVRRARLLQKYS